MSDKYTIINRKSANLIDAKVNKKGEDYFEIDWYEVDNPEVITINEKFYLDEFNWDETQLKTFRKFPVQDQIQVIRIEKLLEALLNFRILDKQEEGESIWKIKADSLVARIQTICNSEEFKKNLTADSMKFIEDLLSRTQDL